jgi:DNA-binding transcriptional LysR family regulator
VEGLVDRIAIPAAFVKVAEAGSFVSAAKRLSVTAAVVTKHVQVLERRLGIRLLNRTTPKVSLTEAGSRYYQRCARVLSDFTEAERLARSLKSAPSGTLRVNADTSLARVLGPIVADYVARYSGVAFELTTNDQAADLVDEQFDLTVRAGDFPDRTSLIRRRIGMRRFALCASETYLARAGVPRHPLELARYNCLIWSHSPADRRWRFTGTDGCCLVEIDGNLCSNSIELLRAATIAGQGISLLPLEVVVDDLWTGRLRRLLPDNKPRDATVYAIHPACQHVSVNLRTFLDYLVEQWPRDVDLDHPRQITGDVDRRLCCTVHPDQQG